MRRWWPAPLALPSCPAPPPPPLRPPAPPDMSWTAKGRAGPPGGRGRARASPPPQSPWLAQQAGWRGRRGQTRPPAQPALLPCPRHWTGGGALQGAGTEGLPVEPARPAAQYRIYQQSISPLIITRSCIFPLVSERISQLQLTTQAELPPGRKRGRNTAKNGGFSST